ADKDGTSGPPSVRKKTALIVVGEGQDNIKAGRSDAQFDAVIMKEFEKYVPGYVITLKHVASAKAMTNLIAGSSWDAVFYFGHGVISSDQKLNPAHVYRES